MSRLRVHPGLSLLAVLVAGLLLERLAPIGIPALRGIFVRGLGVAVTLAALAWGLWARATVKAAGSSVEPGATPTRLVEGGPFRRSRNPMYLAQVMLLAGLGFTAFPWLLAGAPLELLILDRLVIPAEEGRLAAAFGASFEAYRSRVRRWL